MEENRLIDLSLPESVRIALAKPFGPIFQTEEIRATIGFSTPVFLIGDVVSRDALALGITPRAHVCDYKTKRGEINPEFVATLANWGDLEIKVANPAGLLTAAAQAACKQAIQSARHTRIVVDGEEDLLGLCFFAWAPIGSAILYGAPGKGAVVAILDEKLQNLAKELLERMYESSRSGYI